MHALAVYMTPFGLSFARQLGARANGRLSDSRSHKADSAIRLTLVSIPDVYAEKLPMRQAGAL